MSTPPRLEKRTIVVVPSPPPWRAVVAVLALALVVRLAWAVLVPVSPVSDSAAYETFARNLAAGASYGWDGQAPSAYWPVGTAFIYSLAYRVCDPGVHGYGAVIALNLAAGMAVIGLAMALAWRWFGRAPALVSGALLALWPMHVQFTTIIASELFFTAACLGGMLTWPAGAAGDRRAMMARLIGAGVLFAIAAYIRPTALLVPVVLSMAGVFRDGQVLRNASRLAVVGLVMAAAIAPWSLRNFAVFDRFVLISTNGGANLWMGNNPESRGAYQPIPDRPAGMSEAEFDSHLAREAMAFIRADPLGFAARTIIKGVRLHERETIGIAWNSEGLSRRLPQPAISGLKWGTQGYWIGVLGMALVGMGLLAQRAGLWRLMTHPAVLIWGYFVAVHAVIVYQDRYHFPVTPLIGGIAAVALVHLWNRGRCGTAGQEQAP
jgi:hypothetical protein